MIEKPQNQAQQLDQVWQEYQQALKAFLQTKVNNPADVEDLLQEVLLKSFIKLDSLKEVTSMKAWLFQIANHSVIDFYRKNAKKMQSLEGDFSEHDMGQDNQMKTELAQCVQPFIQALTEQQAALLKAIDLDGISQKAYAEQQGIPYSTLKSQVKKARSELKLLFEQCCHFQEDKFGNLIDYERKQVNACGPC